MLNLLIPAAGLSSRFPNMRPKWSLTLPSGKLLIEEVVQSQKTCAEFDRTVVTVVRQQLEKTKGLKNVLKYLHQNNLAEVVVLEEQTRCQPDTVTATIKNAGLKGGLVIKDCDNIFTGAYPSGNFVGYVDLNYVNEVNPSNKSYIEVSEIDVVTNIIEKSVIGPKFCCGVYGFSDAQDYVDSLMSIYAKGFADVGEIFTSNIIYELLIDGTVFRATECSNYTDVGNLEEYKRLQSRSAVYFCDIDGVLTLNSSKFDSPAWSVEFIEENIDALAERCKGGHGGVVLTTSRPLEATYLVKDKLEAVGVKVFGVVSELPHCARTLVNDFAATNPYPSAQSISLPRNSRNLRNYL